MANFDPKKKKAFVPADNPVEQLKNLSGGVIDEAKLVPQGILDEALKQIGLTERRQPLAGEFDLKAGTHQTNEKAPQKDNSAEAQLRQLRAVQGQEKQLFNLKEKATKDQIQKLMDQVHTEVTKLQQQTAELTGEIKSITVDTMPAKVGAYHLNYFDWVISMLKDLRKRVNESRHWLALWAQKKQQKGYWAMFKKHGTSFAMSEERAIASANG